MTSEPPRKGPARRGDSTATGRALPGMTSNAEWTRSAWLANSKQDLLAPAAAIVELAEMLRKDAREQNRDDFLADLDKIHGAGQNLLTLLRDTLNAPPPSIEDPAFKSKVRHDMRTPLNHVIGYCEMWLEDAAELQVEGFVPDLRGVHSLGKQLLGRIDDVFSISKLASDADIDLDSAAVPAMIQQVAVSIPRRQREGLGVETGSLLVVDDNEINRDLLVRRLRREGHSVAVATNGRQALEMVRAQPFDLMLLDIIMPELNGFQVLEQLKADEELRHLAVIMISAFDEIDSVVRCIEMGAEDYLAKPINPVLLTARINACLEKKRLRQREVLYLQQIEQERKRSDDLLHVILPSEIVRQLKATNMVAPRRYENVAVLFCDIVGFTTYCDKNPPELVVTYLQQLVQEWEEIAVQHGVEKIKTIGDAFMAAAGLLQRTADNPVMHCLRCGLQMIEAAQRLPTDWDLRVGIHVGAVVAGVIGRRQYLFDLWGDTVNTAARMESHGVPGSVTLSGTAWRQVAHRCRGDRLSRVLVKGKGRMEVIRFDGFLD